MHMYVRAYSIRVLCDEYCLRLGCTEGGCDEYCLGLGCTVAPIPTESRILVDVVVPSVTGSLGESKICLAYATVYGGFNSRLRRFTKAEKPM